MNLMLLNYENIINTLKQKLYISKTLIVGIPTNILNLKKKNIKMKEYYLEKVD